MHGDYLKVSTNENAELGYGKISASAVNIRSGAGTSYGKVAQAKRGEKAYIIGINNGWYKVKINNKTGYIRSDLMELPDSFDCNSGTNLNSVIEYAKQFLGVPYVWGGTTPNPGFDCSGFTQYVCRHFGVKINRVAVDQMRNGVAVSRNNLKVGDLVFFERTYNTTDAASHVGFYVGNNQFIHAADAGIKISSLNETYYATRYVGARRVF
jgi:cell wall-associated NlpC family hydrolase